MVGVRRRYEIQCGDGICAAVSMAPWLSVRGGARAVEFTRLRSGGGGVSLDGPDGGVVPGFSGWAEFWLGDDLRSTAISVRIAGGGTVRMVLTAADPDAMFARALKAGATKLLRWGKDTAGAREERSIFRTSWELDACAWAVSLRSKSWFI